ncbi:MAG: ribonuclease J, partial [Lachnospiraceae bacterium]|nr:ribonuclease J [Lachnospiraceae bacterium]
ELKLMYALTCPEYAVPVHGEYRHRQANAEIARSMHVEKDHVFLLNSGDVLALSKTHGEVIGSVAQGGVLVDGLGVGDVGNVVLRDRQNLSQDGIIIVAVALSADGGIVSGPELISRGFVYVRESGNILEELKQTADRVVREPHGQKALDRNRVKSEIREALSTYIWKTIKRNPVILPVILEVGE